MDGTCGTYEQVNVLIHPRYLLININQLDALNFLIRPLSICARDGHL